MRTLLLTATALVAFAANSWLCRAALRDGAIDPVGFTAVRLATGAAVLVALVVLRGGFGAPGEGGSLAASAALLAYALPFSLAYLRLDSGLGALVLFGAVQLTMLLGGLAGGHRPGGAEVAGMTLALAGLAVLAAPGRTSPDPAALAGMALAGVGWGIYSLLGRSAGRPLVATAGNFARSLPGVAVALAVAAPWGLHASRRGIALAALSGGVTSGLGYAVWYAALPRLRPVVAGMVQLAVPVIAALGGVALLDERITARLAGSGILVLGGIALAVSARRRPSAAPR